MVSLNNRRVALATNEQGVLAVESASYLISYPEFSGSLANG